MELEMKLYKSEGKGIETNELHIMKLFVEMEWK